MPQNRANIAGEYLWLYVDMPIPTMRLVPRAISFPDALPDLNHVRKSFHLVALRNLSSIGLVVLLLHTAHSWPVGGVPKMNCSISRRLALFQIPANDCSYKLP
jgi:hypothetical protein